ncbi:hypothetical protein CDV36_004503 [Fusarium kuroshium]|uniref:Uncharacterized protein n=1 Tax=Fusarium kuroshium TaxID=2010991 RepID=A0A3M2SE17_9HYPO|nr:hypothetical protein CDV36_004503 [Fusarium kuroshium]
MAVPQMRYRSQGHRSERCHRALPACHDRGNPDGGDNSNDISFKTESDSKLYGGNVIWHENMTVQGNISAIKRLVIQNDRNFPNETDPSVGGCQACRSVSLHSPYHSRLQRLEAKMAPAALARLGCI